MKNMYNTIEVVKLKIKNAKIELVRKDGFYTVSNENVAHRKVLPYLSIVQSTEGSYDISLGNGKMEQTGEGGFFIAPADIQQTIVHHVNPQSGKMSARWIFLDVTVNHSCRLDLFYQFPQVVCGEKKELLHRLFNALFATDDVWEEYSLCYQIVGELMKTAIPIGKGRHTGIYNAVDYIKAHFSQEMSVEELAQSAYMSKSNFYAAFKKQMKMSPIAYLNQFRLSIAADRLTESGGSIKEIGSLVGFGDPLYFSRLFKKMYGVSPKEYRNTYFASDQ